MGSKLSELIEEVVSEFEDNLDKVLKGLGRKDQLEHVSEESCDSLRRKLINCFEVKEVDLIPGPSKLIPRIFKFSQPKQETLMFIFICG